MFDYFDYNKLLDNVDNKKTIFQVASPFPHIVVDNAATHHLANVLREFPGPKDLPWWTYNNPLEVKLAFDDVTQMPYSIRRILAEMNSGKFVSYLEKLTGIQGLIPDPYYAGGGLHQILPGGKLDIHADFNWHKALQLDRRLNVILYLNKDWDPAWGGSLELWDEKMEACQQSISPVYNRMVIFETTDTSYHGHPEIIKCPDGQSRKSLALYYYTNGRPDYQKSESHSTLYQKRSSEPINEQLDNLRKQRAKGRI